MNKQKTSVTANGLIWFGAAVSIAEILTGTFLAPLGFARGVAAILIGHVIGCALLFCAGLIGGRTGKSAMETVKMSFGQKGSLLFSSLNVLQLVGWTAVMIFSGAAAAGAVWSVPGQWFWSLVLGGLILVWLLIGVKHLGGINLVAMGALFGLTVLLSGVIFRGGAPAAAVAGGMSLGAAVELSAAMPLSWLPLISDYTRTAKKPLAATAVSVLVYFAASSWMYIIGLGAALYTGESNVAVIMVKAGLGLAALIIILFSTATTTFLDVYSAGVSAVSISSRAKERPAAMAVCVLGVALAIFTPITRFEAFLYLIGSVFAPMIAIQMVDFFLLKKDVAHRSADRLNLLVWLAGFVIYRLLMRADLPLGSTLPDMLITAALCFGANKVFGGNRNVWQHS